MKHLKYFESDKDSIETIYRNDDFWIYKSPDENLTFTNSQIAKSAIFAMADLITKNSNYLNDDKLRNIKISLANKRTDLYSLNFTFIDNMKKFRTSKINGFISNDIDFIKSISENTYTDLILKYYPIIANIINNSDDFGDIIDDFTKIKPKILKDLALLTDRDNYNL
jgi:hypothetical protein